MRLSDLPKLFERRDLWSIAVYRYERLEDLFACQPGLLAHFHGETGFRVSKDYEAVVADPFLFPYAESLYLFYEVKTDHHHGTIHAKSMAKDGSWQYHGLVLEEPFHLSYPQVFALGTRIFMLPEAAQSGTVRLYESVEFPNRWHHCATLIDSPLRDPTLLAIEDDGFIIVATTPDYRLKFYHSNTIYGPFADKNLVITHDPRFARGAGGILNVNGQLLRPVQDCSISYGKSIGFQLITEFSKSTWLEHHSGLNLFFPLAEWRSRGSHHISCANFGSSVFVAIDGRGPDQLLNSCLLGLIRAAEKLPVFHTKS